MFLLFPVKFGVVRLIEYPVANLVRLVVFFVFHIASNIFLRPSDGSVIDFLHPFLSCNLFKRFFSASAHNSPLLDFNFNNFTVCFYVLLFAMFVNNPSYAVLKRQNSIVAVFSKRYNRFVFMVYAALFFTDSCV